MKPPKGTFCDITNLERMLTSQYMRYVVIAIILLLLLLLLLLLSLLLSLLLLESNLKMKKYSSLKKNETLRLKFYNNLATI